MAEITVWSKQHLSVLDTLERTGRYLARRAYIEKDLGEHAGPVLTAYDWYAGQMARRVPKPPDADYPVWLSYTRGAAMQPSPDSALLELTLEEGLIVPVNISKWGAILNLSFIPADAEDGRVHEALLAELGVYDAKAFMTPFYPDLRRKITASWVRLFDPGVTLTNDYAYGTVWELRREWLKSAERNGTPSTARLKSRPNTGEATL